MYLRALATLFKKALFLFILFVTAIIAILSAITFSGAANLPDISDVKKIAVAQTTKIYSSDKVLLSKVYAEDRLVVPLNNISKHMADATIATEDKRFFNHPGVDLASIIRATIRDIALRRIEEGGSTITQQYVKNAYFSPERTIMRKISEAILSIKLERSFTKRQILEKYLNTIYFGHGAYGIESASRRLFNKRAKDLDLNQSVVLAGLIKNPAKYSPVNHPEEAAKRRNHILRLMAKYNFIDEKTANAVSKMPIKVNKIKDKTKAPYFVEFVKKELFKMYGEETLLRGGLTVYTTLNWKVQYNAEKESTRYFGIKNDPSSAVVAIDPNTGGVLAMVGGNDFNTQKFNLATQAKRQPGSAFKPFVLAAALQDGISPDKVFDASSPKKFDVGGKKWEVTNYEGASAGNASLREASYYSINTVFAKLITDVGVQKVIQMAHNLGIASPISQNPAIALGGLEKGISPFEMASAYSSFATGGFHYQNYAVSQVNDSRNKIIYQAVPVRTKVIGDEVAYLMNDVLKGVISGGTGHSAKLDITAAGKTGTTQNHTDAWFIGYTSKIAACVWVGYPKSRVPMNNIHGVKVTGGTYPAKIWANFMKEVTKNWPDVDFDSKAKKNIISVKVCDEPSMQKFLATQYCPDQITELFITGFEPTLDCPYHRPAKAGHNRKEPSFNEILPKVENNKTQLKTNIKNNRKKSKDKSAAEDIKNSEEVTGSVQQITSSQQSNP